MYPFTSSRYFGIVQTLRMQGRRLTAEAEPKGVPPGDAQNQHTV